MLLSTPAPAAPGVPCELYGINAGAPVWQGQVVLDSAFAGKLAATGARAVRVDFLVDDQPTWNETALKRYDAIVDATLAAGLEPLGAMNYGAVNGGQAAWNDDADGDGYNPYVEAFASQSKVLLQRYAGKIHHWEIWNEPNCWNDPGYATNPKAAGCSYILPRVYAKMLAEVFIRNESLLAQSSISLVSGGLFAHDIGGSASTAADYMTEVYAQGVWDWMQANKGRRYAWDRLGYHLYVDQDVQTDGKKLGQYLDAVRALATQKSDSSPFLLTEVGWTTDAVSESVQAANVGTTFALLEKRADVERVYWFSYQDFPGGSWGVVDLAGALKPAHAALKTATAGCTAGSGGAAGAGGASGAGGTAGGGGGALGGGAGTTSGGSGPGGVGGNGTGAGAGAGGAKGGSTSPADDEGCGCRATSTGGRGAWLALVALFLLRRRAKPL